MATISLPQHDETITVSESYVNPGNTKISIHPNPSNQREPYDGWWVDLTNEQVKELVKALSA